MGPAARGAVRVALAAAVVLSAVALSERTGTTAVHTTAPRGALRTVAVPAGADPARRVLPARTTEPFRMVGVTWSDARTALGGTAQIRTRSATTGRWSPWRDLELDVHAPESGPEHAADGLRGGTQPLWVGPSDGVQARITGAKLPAGLRVDLVDPDSGAKESAPAPAGAATAAGQPDIVPRSGWGADESIVADPPTYTTDTKAVFVHHTAGTNDYTCAESASIIRGIFVYHVQSNGWNDIGYNFLVDKCGTVFEGRAGGVDKPVYGAHTYGFNTDTSGVAVLGDYNTATAPQAVRDSVAKLAAWKLGLYGINPSGTVVMAAGADNGKYTQGQLVTLNRISGHRDGYPTECPGTNLYGDLPAIRALAAAANSPAPTGDMNRDGHADLAAGVPKATANGLATAGQVTVVPGARSGPYAGNKAVITQESDGVPGGSEAGDGFGSATAYGDFDHDGYQDLVVASPGEEVTAGASDEGALSLLRGTANGLAGQAGMVNEPSGVRASGARFGAALATGDFDGDGGDDILAVAPGSARAWAIDGADRTFSAPVQLASGGGALSEADIATGDFDHDGYEDAALTFRTAGGTTPLVVLRGSATGLRTDAPAVLDGAGGRALASADLNGDGYADLAVGRPDVGDGGEISTFHGSADGLTTTGAPVLGRGAVPGGESGDRLGASLAAGDTDGDGYADVLAGAPGEDVGTAADAGAALLLHGGPDGLTATGAEVYDTDLAGVPGAAETDDRLGSAVALADLTGDGAPDLVLGADGENTGDGTVLTLNGGPDGVVPESGAYYGTTALGTSTAAGIGGVLAR
ncbi:FG-GAP-like repeat-containing protein [Streptomyces sp. NBC_00996]|uniref:FG-GAP-like repeat-containing protein n=1 Tax=Streptomyces sp. NBC_00996 TaxID=2903710 RepID=UPI00386AFD18|nr:FG-GAP-like repeat-containing protein [Streptomyces sp. NBC_00996]